LRKQYKELDLEFPTLEQFLELHEGGDTYGLFLAKILPRIVGKCIWTSTSSKKQVSQFCTKSDEAFGLLLLENFYARWTWMWENGVLKDKNREAPLALYTNCGDTKGTGGSSNRKLEGWSRQGYERFNVLHGLVAQDRAKQSRVAFEEQIRVDMEHELASKRIKKIQQMEVTHVGSYPAHDFEDVIEGGIGLAVPDVQVSTGEHNDGQGSSNKNSRDDHGSSSSESADDDEGGSDDDIGDEVGDDEE
jgi:hypothetical protein